jgi:hypothetical protein
MHFACRITKATDTHSEYIILIAFPRQNWLSESAFNLYVYCSYFYRKINTFLLSTRAALDCIWLTTNYTVNAARQHVSRISTDFVWLCFVYLAMPFNSIRRTVSWDRTIISSDFERLWKDTVTASSKLLPRRLPHATLLAVSLKANSHMPCRAYAAPMPFPCHAVPLEV